MSAYYNNNSLREYYVLKNCQIEENYINFLRIIIFVNNNL